MTGWIGISLGDVTGIGPEVALKALAAEKPADGTRFLLIGDTDCIRRTNHQTGLQLPIESYTGLNQTGRFFAHNPLSEPLPADLPAGSPAAAQAALDWLADGAPPPPRAGMGALVTSPGNKQASIRAGHPFVGPTENI